MQIYSGSMEREFVPVEKRGGGKAKDDSHLPAHLRNSFPHTNSEATVTAGMLSALMHLFHNGPFMLFLDSFAQPIH